MALTFSARALAVDVGTCGLLGGLGDLVCQRAVEGRAWATTWRRAGDPPVEETDTDPRRAAAAAAFTGLYVGGFLHFLYRAYPAAVAAAARAALPAASPARARLLDETTFAHAHACGWVDALHCGALYIPAYFVGVGFLQGDEIDDATAALKGAWMETWLSCTAFWVPYMSANFLFVPSALRVRAMAVGNLAWSVAIDYLAHRDRVAAAPASRTITATLPPLSGDAAATPLPLRRDAAASSPQYRRDDAAAA